MNARMMRWSMAAVVVGLAGSVHASPGLDIRSIGAGPIGPGIGPAGPAADPTTQQGQWFLMNNGVADARSHEFYDNIDGNGGGAPNHLAINGSFLGYISGTGGVTAYQMNVSITNNTPLSFGPIATLANTHGESRVGNSPRYVGDMLNVRFTAHWADDGVAGNFQQGVANIGSSDPGPAFTSPGTSNTFAIGHDGLAWYSYTQPLPGTIIGGSYQVPTWDFGNIAVGQTVTRTLTFRFYQPVAAANLPPASQLLGQDLLINRTTDVKIGTYFQDDPVVRGIFDQQLPYPPGSMNSATGAYGNCSVFFDAVPSPGSAGLAAIGALLAGGRRRRVRV